MKLKYRLLFKCKWCLKIQRWYRWTFHRQRTLDNFRAFLESIENEEANIK